MPDTLTEAEMPVFGRPVPGADYHDRPTVYGIVPGLSDAGPSGGGLIATVRIARPAGDFWDLPGGMLDPGEGALEALRRECLEEIGWEVAPLTAIASARQYTTTSAGERRHNIARYYLCRAVADRDGKVEADHTLVWLDAREAMNRMRHEAAAWAIGEWLKSGVRADGA